MNELVQTSNKTFADSKLFIKLFGLKFKVKVKNRETSF